MVVFYDVVVVKVWWLVVCWLVYLFGVFVVIVVLVCVGVDLG